MELLDLYDDFGNKLDKVIERGNIPKNGTNIMLSIIFIRDNKNRFLIQKTSKLKGGLYSTTGGHVTSSEDSKNTIIREVYEELGLDISNRNIKLLDTIKYPNKPLIFRIYDLVLDNININNTKLQTTECESIYLVGII